MKTLVVFIGASMGVGVVLALSAGGPIVGFVAYLGSVWIANKLWAAVDRPQRAASCPNMDRCMFGVCPTPDVCNRYEEEQKRHGIR
jgi:hypothetical protein